MRKLVLIMMASWLALLLSACQQPSAQPDDAVTLRNVGSLQFRPCTLTNNDAGASVQAQCAQLQVAENPAQPQGRQISLRIAWLEAGNPGVNADPVFFLAGGPGQGATEVAVAVDAALREVRKQRDIFLIDQRGTGGSQPLNCVDASGKPLPEPTTAAEDSAGLLGYARACADSLRERVDLRYYTTSAAVADLEAVRAALGLHQINLIAVSYGTRLAQQYAHRHPDSVRALVLDGVVPNELVLGSELADTFEQAIVQQGERCQADASCRRRFPYAPRLQLQALLQRLHAAPLKVHYLDPGSAASVEAELSRDSVTGLALAFAYSPQTMALLPLVLDEAAQQRYGPLLALTELVNRRFGEQINRPLQWSVICSEDADRYRASPATTSLLGAEVVQRFYAVCPVWPHGSRPADFNQPLQSSLPSLLLSGQYDPVTPPRYAEQVLKGLANGRHLVLPGQGHNVMGQGCVPRLLAQFLQTADARGLDVQCVQDTHQVPVFTSFNGWEP